LAGGGEMLLAIDVGNSKIGFGVWDGKAWAAGWQFPTRDAVIDALRLQGRIEAELRLAHVSSGIQEAILCSVAPEGARAVRAACDALGIKIRELMLGRQAGLEVGYERPEEMGADRVANALGALAIARPPLIVVDFGTATTVDAIDRHGTLLGGAILAGGRLSARALAGGTAQLPEVELSAPEEAIGRSTREAIQSGLVLGHAGAVDRLVKEFEAEVGRPTVIATGGLSGLFAPLCGSITRVEPQLTLRGLAAAAGKLRPLPGGR